MVLAIFMEQTGENWRTGQTSIFAYIYLYFLDIFLLIKYACLYFLATHTTITAGNLLCDTYLTENPLFSAVARGYTFL